MPRHVEKLSALPGVSIVAVALPGAGRGLGGRLRRNRGLMSSERVDGWSR